MVVSSVAVPDPDKKTHLCLAHLNNKLINSKTNHFRIIIFLIEKKVLKNLIFSRFQVGWGVGCGSVIQGNLSDDPDPFQNETDCKLYLEVEKQKCINQLVESVDGPNVEAAGPQIQALQVREQSYQGFHPCCTLHQGCIKFSITRYSSSPTFF